MSTIFIDFENVYVPKKLSLDVLPLRTYLERAPIIGVAYAIDDEPAAWVPSSERAQFLDWIEAMGEFMQDPENIVVAYNVAYDARVLRFGRLAAGDEPLGLPFPPRVRDAMELAMAAWPNQPTGYKLEHMAKHFGLPPKLSMQDAQKGNISWEEYCTRDVVLCREVYRRALKRVSSEEVRISELANCIRELHYEVDGEQVAKSLAEFTTITREAVENAYELFESTGRDGSAMAEAVFGGVREGAVRSVKPLALRKVLIESLGFDTQTTSLKKIEPAKLNRAAPEVAKLLAQTSAAGKGLYYARRTAGLVGTREVDMELGYFRATNTGRYSAPTCGKGLNKHNMSKRDAAVARPLRQMFALPSHLCFVRADASNVEYRGLGRLSQCQYVLDLFHTDINADPYSAFATAAFGVQSVSKPLRQLCKAAVLGLGFCMSLQRWATELSKMVADPKSGLTLSDLSAIVAERGWKPPSKGFVRGVQTRLGCAWEIVTVAYESREAFQRIHHEFFDLANWLQYAVEKAAGSSDPERALDYCYGLHGAPARDLLDLSIDRDLEYPTVRVRCLGHSMPTVTWRHLSVTHPGVDGLGAVTANKGPRRVHRSLLIENVTQSSARNRLVGAVAALNAQGYRWIDSVHDEIRLVVPREPGAILKARADLLGVMKDWDFYAKPDSVTCTRTEFEDEVEARQLFAKLSAGDETWTRHLT